MTTTELEKLTPKEAIVALGKLSLKEALFLLRTVDVIYY